MGEENSRRRLLRGLAATGFATISGRPVSAARGRSNTIEIRSEGGGVAAYEFTVSGSIKQQDGGDRVSGNRASGHLGPDRGTDTFSYSGDITGFALAGPARVFDDGYRFRPALRPAPDGVLTAGDFPSRSGTKTLRIASDGGGFGVYEFEVNGSVRQLDSGDHAAGDRVYGHVGPDRGVDEFEYTGDVTDFTLAGPASASLDGDSLTPGNSHRSVVRVGSRSELTARPETTLLFEALARGYRGDRPSAAWYVDGRRRYGPDAFYGQLGTNGRSTFTHAFDETGTHRIRVDLYDQGKANEEGADPIGTVRWTVRVTPDGNRPPTVERVTPKADTLTVARDATEPVEFAATAEDADGELDRIVWWMSQCDVVVGVSPASGSRDTARLSYAPEPGCPLVACAIDERGAMAWSDPWLVEPEGN